MIFFILLSCFLPKNSQADEDFGLNNLVINKTLTRFGNDFYIAFSNHWAPPENVITTNIRIQEAPSARWGSLIIIWVGDEIFFRTSLSARSKNIEAIANEAADQILSALLFRTIQQQTKVKNDLQGDGL